MAAEEDDLDLDQEDQEDLEPDNAPTQALPAAPAPRPQATGWQPAPGAQPISVASAAASPRSASGWQPAPGAQPISIANVEPKKTEGVSFKDYGKAAWASAIELGQDLLGASSFAARKIAESPELVTAAETARRQLADHMAGVVSSMSPDAQKAFHSSLFGGGEPGPTGPSGGLLASGNIDLGARPSVKNPDGSVSTVRSMSFNDGRNEVLIPTVAADGSRILSDQEAIDQYRRTGQFLGKFDTPDHATEYAQKLHKAQEQYYGAGHVPTPGEVGWGHYAGMTLASFIPDAVMLVLPGGVVGKAVEKTLVSPAIRTAAKAGDLAAQASVKAGEGVAQATSAATTGASFGAQMAGSAYSHIVDEVDRAKPEEMMRSAVYAHAREQGMSDPDAKRLVIDQVTPHIAAQAALGLVTGAGLGQVVTRGAMGAAGASTGRRVAIGAAEGAGTMAAQAGGGNALEQAASINAGTRKEFDPSETARALASGALGGALLGAGGGLLHGRGVPEAAQAERTPAEEQQLALPPPDHVSPEQNAALQLALPKPETSYGPETPAWTRAGEGLIPGSGSFTMRPSDGRVPTPEAEPGQRQLPPPATGYGEGFTMPPRGTPAVPTDTALPAPEARTLLPPTDRSRGEGFVTSPSADTSTAKPSGGMNRGNLVEQLTQLGRNPQELRRMKIDELRSAFDEAKTQPEPTRQEFRPTTPMADQSPDLGKVPVRGDQPVDQVATKAAEPIVVQKEVSKPTVGDQLKAKRQVEKQRMAEGVVGLIKRDEAKPRKPEVKLEEPDEPSGPESQPQVYEPSEGAPTTVVEPGEARGRSDKTTNLDRKLSDLESDITNGLKTPAEASAEYGKKELAGGRDRTYPDLENYLHERVKDLSDPAKEQALIDKAQRLQEDKKLTKEQRNTLTRELNEEINRRDPEYIQKLKDALDEIRAESKAKGGKALGDLKARLAAKKAEPTSRKVPFLSNLLAGTRINKPVRDIFTGSKEPVRAHEYLKAIANDQVLRVRLPQAVALARRLLDMVPEDVHVVTHAQAREIGLRPDRTAVGQYFPRDMTKGSPIIVMQRPDRLGGRSYVEVMLHESLHSITDKYLSDIEHTNHPDAVVMRRIGSELRDALRERRDGLSKAEIRDIEYGLSDIHELHTMLMSDPIIQRFAAEVMPSDYFKERMRQLGYPLKPSTSLWQSFTTWVRRIVGLPDSSATLFDHILRPLQDIADRADRYNRDELPQDEVLRSVAAPAAEAASHALPRLNREGAREVVDRIDPKGVGHGLYRGVLQAATGDGITRRWRELFEPRQLTDEHGRLRTSEGKPVLSHEGNPLEELRTAREGVSKASKNFHDEWSETAADLMAKAGKLNGVERDKLGQLMNDSTISETKLGTDALNANAHLTKAEQQQALSRLQQQYNGLSREARAVYNGFRDYYAKTNIQERTASLSSVIKRAIPDATKSEVEELTKAVKTKGGIQKLIDSPDESDVARAFADRWGRNRYMVREIAKIQKLGFVQGDYFPLRRYGEYVIHYGTKGTGDYGVEMFEKYSHAEARREELRKAQVEPSQIMSKREMPLRHMLPESVIHDLDNAVRHAGFKGEQADALRDTFASMWLQQANRSEAARSRMRRQGVKGASTDFMKVAARDFLATQARMGYLERGPDMANALDAMRRHVDWLGDNGKPGEQITANAILQEMQKRQTAGDDDFGKWVGFGQRMSQMGYVYSLMSPSHMITSTIEAHENAAAWIGARHGFIRAGLQLGKALKDTAPVMTVAGAKNTMKALRQGLKAADWNLSTVVRDQLISKGADRQQMIALGNELNNAGLIDHTFVREFQRIAGHGTNLTNGWYGRFLDLNGAMAHSVDVANKWAIAKAAYDLEYRKTGSAELSRKYSVEMVRQSIPNYNIANKSRISTSKGVLGPLAAPLTQFKQYGVHMYNMLGVLLHESMNGATPTVKKEARWAFGAILTTHALMAGSLTLIADPLRYIMGAYDWIVNGSGRPHDYQNDIRGWIADAFGPELGEVISRGVPHALGIDIHRRVGLANLLEIPELKEFSAKGWTEMLATAMLGASGQDAATMAGALNKLRQGDLAGGLKDLTPRVVRDAMKASNLAEKGVTDSKGKTILPAKKLSSYDVAAQAAGFQPSRVSEFREKRAAEVETITETRDDRSKAMTAFTVAGSADARKTAVERVREYNKTHPDSPITYSQLLQAQKRQAEQVVDTKSGGLLIPKHQRPRVERAGSFANSP